MLYKAAIFQMKFQMRLLDCKNVRILNKDFIEIYSCVTNLQ